MRAMSARPPHRQDRGDAPRPGGSLLPLHQIAEGAEPRLWCVLVPFRVTARDVEAASRHAGITDRRKRPRSSTDRTVAKTAPYQREGLPEIRAAGARRAPTRDEPRPLLFTGDGKLEEHPYRRPVTVLTSCRHHGGHVPGSPARSPRRPTRGESSVETAQPDGAGVAIRFAPRGRRCATREYGGLAVFVVSSAASDVSLLLAVESDDTSVLRRSPPRDRAPLPGASGAARFLRCSFEQRCEGVGSSSGFI